MAQQIRERQHVDSEEVDDKLLDRMFDVKRQDMPSKRGDDL